VPLSLDGAVLVHEDVRSALHEGDGAGDVDAVLHPGEVHHLAVYGEGAVIVVFALRTSEVRHQMVTAFKELRLQPRVPRITDIRLSDACSQSLRVLFPQGLRVSVSRIDDTEEAIHRCMTKAGLTSHDYALHPSQAELALMELIRADEQAGQRLREEGSLLIQALIDMNVASEGMVRGLQAMANILRSGLSPAHSFEERPPAKPQPRWALLDDDGIVD
jgi:hypothetical protein